MNNEMLLNRLEKQVRILKAYAIALTVAILGFVAYSFTVSNSRFKEITAERINIVEKDGKVRMVLSNHEMQHPGRMDGRQLPKRERPAGMIFFNDAGDECGGLVFDGDKNSASMTYSVDQWKNDQVMQLQYAQESGDTALVKSYGLKLWERSDKFTLSRLISYSDSLKKLNSANAYEAGMQKLKVAGLLQHERLFIGRAENGEVGLFLSDTSGAPRLKIFINAQNQPVIETLDQKGNVISTK